VLALLKLHHLLLRHALHAGLVHVHLAVRLGLSLHLRNLSLSEHLLLHLHGHLRVGLH